jgi:2-methylisocitrate lyase-like PEP mutase family enzyme
LEAALERAEAYLAAASMRCSSRRCAEADASRVRTACRVFRCWRTWSKAKTPVTPADELDAWVRIVIFPGGTATGGGPHAAALLGSLRQHQSTAPERARMLDFDQLNALIGTPELLRQAAHYAEDARV